VGLTFEHCGAILVGRAWDASLRRAVTLPPSGALTSGVSAVACVVLNWVGVRGEPVYGKPGVARAVTNCRRRRCLSRDCADKESLKSSFGYNVATDVKPALLQVRRCSPSEHAVP
jgi:hypothetical protein